MPRPHSNINAFTELDKDNIRRANTLFKMYDLSAEAVFNQNALRRPYKIIFCVSYGIIDSRIDYTYRNSNQMLRDANRLIRRKTIGAY